MSQALRQSRIHQLVKQKGYLTIDELVAHFSVTPQTIRRDLNQMAEDGLIERHHGGAGVASSAENTAYQTRKIQHLAEKTRISEQVAMHIPDHSSLFINIGTTNETVAQALLGHKGLKVVTNNLHVASILSNKPDFTVIIAGGQVRSRDGGIVGEATRDFVHQFKLDYGIIGISGIDDEGTLLDFDYQEVRIAQAIMENSRYVYLAADHSKFGRNAMVRLGNLNQCSAFFTDQRPSQSLVDYLTQQQVDLHIC
ncbi:MAG: DeoR/GlpR family transcriptional regulator [Natronospirillum sp.]|uniref:DeoR/GlpR family transcriptional regulator n=1 Tax=Natronospirillum sp. TaxID=2812955 RepID=UPI0025CE0B8A|nr:DeoR/GlpR family transcriptional regulator [Natronospirillum sp.]MCH8551490.1 DeoR/GlpR family transcriptional regulator [Natronospirillum sp.]